MKKILLLATGGTIASVESAEGLAPGMSPEEILDYIPECRKLCDISVKQLFSIDSTNIEPSHWLAIASEIRSMQDAYDAFLITHGTDTMAYTASALSYLVQNFGKPVILTGSQKPIGDPLTDAKKNLMDSIRFALQDNVRGVYVVFDGKAILGTRARKVRSKKLSAFDSINYPVAAVIDDARVIRYMDDNSAPGEPRFYDSLNESVFLLKLIPGIRPDILPYLGEHYDVIVIEGYGVGGVPFFQSNDFLREVELLTSRGKIIVIATQVMFEGSDADKYEVGVRAMQNYNVLQSYDMTIEACCTKLMWITAMTDDFSEIRRMFYTRIASDILYEGK